MSRGHVSFRGFFCEEDLFHLGSTKHSISNYFRAVPVSGTLVTYNATVAIKL